MIHAVKMSAPDDEATDSDHKESPSYRRGFQMLFGNVVLPLAHRAIDDGYAVGLGVGAHAATEPAGHPHQMRVIQPVIGSAQLPPPQAKPTGAVPRPKIAVQHNPIDTVAAKSAATHGAWLASPDFSRISSGTLSCLFLFPD